MKPFVPDDHCLYLDNGKFDPDEPNNLERIFAAYEKTDGSPPLAVHFHGGLVDKAGGKQIAKFLYEKCYGDVAYPVFFVWESGFKDSVRQSLPRIFGEAVFQTLLSRITGFALGKINKHAAGGGRGAPITPEDEFTIREEMDKALAGEIPFSDRDPSAIPPGETLDPAAEEPGVIAALENDPRLREEAARIAAGLRSPEEIEAERRTAPRGAPVAASTATLMSPEVIDEMRPDPAEVDAAPDGNTRGLISSAAVAARLAKGGVNVLRRVIERSAARRDHGIQATVIQEILREFYLGNFGKNVWEAIKQNTRNAFNDDPQQFGGAAFLLKLRDLHERGAAPPRILLVGHSTGAVSICYLLEAADRLGLPPEITFEVVFLGAACNFALFREAVEKHGARIAKFRSFGMSETVEQAEFLLESPALAALPPLQRLYPGSLLYVVSGVFEDEADTPIVGLARHFRADPYDDARFPDVATVRRLLFSDPSDTRWVWSKSPEDAPFGLASASIRHGDFDEDEPTLRSLAHILRTGF